MAQQAFVFHARLLGYRGVTRTVAVRGDQTLIDLHRILQQGFEWDDEHLYSFWLTGTFWDARQEYTAPFEIEPPARSADIRLDRLALELGQKIAYIFDFGEEWRVGLTLKEVVTAGAGSFPRMLESRGEAPPQYAYDDETEVA
jgi:hypothetical protein